MIRRTVDAEKKSKHFPCFPGGLVGPISIILIRSVKVRKCGISAQDFAIGRLLKEGILATERLQLGGTVGEVSSLGFD